MTLNVMVLESERGTADTVRLELTHAGHEVLGCHDPGASSFPCLGLEEQSKCPLRSHSVDLAVTVRTRHRSQPTPTEDGIRCALMHRIPLVVVGAPILDPFEPFETRVIDPGDDVVGACEEVAASALPRHTRVATDALRAARNPGDASASGTATVTRRNGYLRVSVAGLDGLAPRELDAALVRMRAKLREYDSSARGMDVTYSRQLVPVATEARHSS